MAQLLGDTRRNAHQFALIVVAIDCVALLAAWAVARPGGIGTMLLLAALVLSLNAIGGHYRVQMTASLVRELPGVVGRAVVAGSLATTLRVVLDLPVQEGPLTAALVFAVLACLGRAGAYPLMRRPG